MSSTGSSTSTRRTPASPVAEGDVVDGKYRAERLLAAGGMGVVVVARHLVLDQPVALKFLIPHVQDDGLVARFLREARAAAKVQSEHVVRVFDCGTLKAGVPYMAMELLEGRDLAQELKAEGAMRVEPAVDVALAALEGVGAAHALGIVHRDLKPSNIFLASRGARSRTVKVLDFGISKPLAGPDTPIEDDLTGTAVMLGSPRYASPEQAQSSRNVDVRTDIWSMGVVLYEMLDGRCPFQGGTMGEVLAKVLLHKYVPLAGRRDVPEALDRVIARCLTRDREDRWPDAASLARALAPFGSAAGRVHADRIAAILGEPEPAKITAGDGAAVGEGATDAAPPVALAELPPPRPPLASDAALTDVRPAPRSRADLPTVPELPPPAGPVVTAAAPPAAAAAAIGESTSSTFATSTAPPRSRVGLAIVALALGLAGGIASFAMLRDAPSAPAAASPPSPADPGTGHRTPDSGTGTPETGTGTGTGSRTPEPDSGTGTGSRTPEPPPPPSASASTAPTPPPPTTAPTPPRPAARTPSTSRPPPAGGAGVLDRSD